MQLKRGVKMQGLNIKMRIALMYAEEIWKSYDRPEGVTVTSAVDGLHSAGSLHYYGYALDFRIHYFTPEEALAVSRELSECLGNDFDVILESDHIHVEYDPDTRKVYA
jgi:hypothetical protein